jgi:hypothetical protein
MHKNATKCNKTQSKWCINKHGASKIIDTFEMYQAHPKTNGQVEKSNILICNGINKRLLAPLEKAKHAWVDELPSVLWSLRTTPNAATQDTPFSLVHSAEAVLPVEITHEAPRIATYDESSSNESLQDDVNALDEARDVALARAMQYQ